MVVVLAAAFAIGVAKEKTARTDVPAHLETATLRSGCFWSLQETLRQIPGVIKTTAGYTGGTVTNPTYELVATRKTGHAEAVEVVFDPAKLSYEQLLADFLTSRKAASRSGIFYHSEEQRQTAERVKEKINQSGKGNSPVMTEITNATAFYPAEEYHQDYYRKNSGARSCSVF